MHASDTRSVDWNHADRAHCMCVVREPIENTLENFPVI